MSTVSTRTRTFVHFVQQHPVVQAATETLRKLTSGRRDEVRFCSCSCLSKGHSLIFSSPPAGVRKPTEFCALGSKGMLRQGGASLRQGHNEQVCLRCDFHTAQLDLPLDGSLQWGRTSLQPWQSFHWVLRLWLGKLDRCWGFDLCRMQKGRW